MSNEMKSILNEWKNFNNRLNEMSRLYSQDPENFDETEFNRVGTTKSLDKTDSDLRTFIEEICSFVDKYNNLFVSFVDQYDEDTPSLGVSPTITWNTPHGIYGYPLNKDNVFQFLTKGEPTESTFATDKEFIHIYRMNDIKTVNVKKDYSTNYNDRNYIKDVKTIVTLYLNYLTAFLFKEYSVLAYYTLHAKKYKDISVDKIAKLFLEKIKPSSSHNQDVWATNNQRLVDISDSIMCFISIMINNGVIEENKSIPVKVINLVCDYYDYISSTKINKFSDRIEKSKFYQLYFMAFLLSNTMNNIEPYTVKSLTSNAVKPGGMLTMLLTAIGVNGINDSMGTSLLHSNEPSQSVIIDTNNSDNFELLGTYTNIFHYLDYEDNDHHAERVQNILFDLAKKGKIDSSILRKYESSYVEPDLSHIYDDEDFDESNDSLDDDNNDVLGSNDKIKWSTTAPQWGSHPKK